MQPMIDQQIFWWEVDDISKANLFPNRPYLACLEVYNNGQSEWHMILAYWYNKGDVVTLREKDNTPHYYNIEENGLYIINDTGDNHYNSIYRVNNPSYIASVLPPRFSPDESLLIEKR